jgi:DNA-directed RNA polymerase subunit RPC12/RpoP
MTQGYDFFRYMIKLENKSTQCHDKVRDYKCTQCDCLFPSIAKVRYHKCTQCDFVFLLMTRSETLAPTTDHNCTNEKKTAFWHIYNKKTIKILLPKSLQNKWSTPEVTPKSFFAPTPSPTPTPNPTHEELVSPDPDPIWEWKSNSRKSLVEWDRYDAICSLGYWAFSLDILKLMVVTWSDLTDLIGSTYIQIKGSCLQWHCLLVCAFILFPLCHTQI